jgi:hypothetical protein
MAVILVGTLATKTLIFIKARAGRQAGKPAGGQADGRVGGRAGRHKQGLEAHCFYKNIYNVNFLIILITFYL